MKYVVKTLGCKANLYDSQILEATLKKQGWGASGGADTNSETEVCIVNSCTVTDEAEKQSRRMARQLKKQYPNAKIVMTGCSAEADPKDLLKESAIDYVIGNRDKPDMVKMLEGKMERTGTSSNTLTAGSSDALTPSGPQILGTASGYTDMKSQHPMDREWPLPENLFFAPSELDQSGRTRAFLKIQEGCNSFCTFCIIPYGRGPCRSLRPRQVIDQINQLVEQGVKEVVLTGTNVGEYGVDWLGDFEEQSEPANRRPGGQPHALGELTRMIFENTELPRLRISSLDPVQITDELINFAATEPRFCPHFHVSLQSPHSHILKLMKRRYGSPEVRACLEKLAQTRSPSGESIYVGMDLITGFPGETDEIWQETLQLMKELPWTRLHVFPYSERSGTPATKLPESYVVDKGERKRRSRELNQLSFERVQSFYHSILQKNRTIEDVLLESPVVGPDGTKNWIAGHSRNYLRVLLPKDAGQTNHLVGVRPQSVVLDSQKLEATLLSRLV